MKEEKDKSDLVTNVADKIGQIAKLMTNLEKSADMKKSREFSEIKESFNKYQRSLNMVEADETKTSKSQRQSQRLSVSTNPLDNFISRLETLIAEVDAKQQLAQNSRASLAVEPSRRQSLASSIRRQPNAPLSQASSQPASPQLPIKNKPLDNLLREEGIQSRRSSVSENKAAVQPASSPAVTAKSDWQRKDVSEPAVQKVEAEKKLAATEANLETQAKELRDQIFDAEPTAAELDAAEKKLAAAEEKLDAQVKELTDQIFDAEPTAAELDAVEKKQAESMQQGASQEQGVKASQGSPVQKASAALEEKDLVAKNPESASPPKTPERTRNVRLKAQYQGNAVSVEQQSQASASSVNSSPSPGRPVQSWTRGSVQLSAGNQASSSNQSASSNEHKDAAPRSPGKN